MLSSILKTIAAAGLIALATTVPQIAQAEDDLIAGSDLASIAEIAKGYGSVKPPGLG